MLSQGSTSSGGPAAGGAGRVHQVLRLLFRVGVAAMLLLILFRVVPIVEVRAAATRLGAVAAALAVAGSFLIQGLIAVRLRLLCAAQRIRFGSIQVLQINLAAMFYGLILPGGNLTGGLVRVAKLSGSKLEMGRTAVAVVGDRFLATAALLVTGYVFWIADAAGPSVTVGIALGLGSAASLALYVLLFHGGITGVRIGRLASRLPLPAKLRVLAGQLRGFTAFSARERIIVLALSIGGQLVGVTVFWILARSLGLGVSWLTLGWTRAAAMLLVILPVSLSGLGVREAAVVFLLRPYGVASADALALSLLLFGTVVMVPGLVGGVWEALRATRSAGSPAPRFASPVRAAPAGSTPLPPG